MNVTIQPNHILVGRVGARLNTPDDPDLIVVEIVELAGPFVETSRVVLNGRKHWQQIVDDLAALGIVAQAAEVPA